MLENHIVILLKIKLYKYTLFVKKLCVRFSYLFFEKNKLLLSEYHNRMTRTSSKPITGGQSERCKIENIRLNFFFHSDFLIKVPILT